MASANKYHPFGKGDIQYDKYLADENGVYSIDRFTFNLRMTETMYTCLDFSLTTFSWRNGNTQCEMFESSRFGVKVKIWQFGNFHVEAWHDTDIRGEEVYAMRVDFSPNHCVNHRVREKFFEFLKTTDQTFTFDLSRVDFAYDIPVPLRNIYVLSRKTEGNVGTTRYYGRRGSSGMLRVYDKREEEKTKRHVDIGREVTRLEWEQRGGKDLTFTFDTFCTADFSGLQYPASVIPYIQPENINSAFRSISKNTRTAYKKLFKPYSIDVSKFQRLLDEYFEELGIMHLRWDYTEHGTKGALADRSDSVSVNLLPSQATLDCNAHGAV